MKSKKSFVAVLMIVFMITFMVAGCNWSTKQNVVTGYEITGTTLATVGDAITDAYKSKVITSEQYTSIRVVYNKAVASFILAGTVQKAWLNTDDAVQKKALFEKYNQLFDEYKGLILDAVNLASTFGINILGGK